MRSLTFVSVRKTTTEDQKMRVQARGAYQMKGTGKTSGNAYDMYNLVIETRQETVSRPNMTRIGLGLDQKELAMSAECFARIQAKNIPFPCACDLTVGSRVGFRGLEAVIEDVIPAQIKAAA